MKELILNTKKLGEIYEEWRGNESCYDNGRPVFDADELLDFAQFCLMHEANDRIKLPISYYNGLKANCPNCGQELQAEIKEITNQDIIDKLTK